jgi:GrpB-like predicted nucleotidyltransferase (UPF0157 family)
VPAPVIVVDYDPTWPLIFQTLADRVAGAMAELALIIEHVGSTAVPGLAAKPIIDMDVVVASEHDISPAIERLTTLGYVHEGDLGIKGREAFSTPGGLPAHHLYLCAADNPELRRHILLRDYLRAHAEVVQRYADVKRAAAESHRDDRQGYMAAKDAVVKEILRSAQATSSG